MLRFIWQNWWRHKERFILLIVGALIVSSGLSYLVGLSQSNKGTVEQTLARHWSASYDIVVRPPDSRNTTEVNHLLEPNYLSGIAGGISIDQYKKIKAIEGVDIAAPIAMIGYLPFNIVLSKKAIVKENGLYRFDEKTTTNIGVKKIVQKTPPSFFPIGTYSAGHTYSPGQKVEKDIPGFVEHEGKLWLFTTVMFAGIDFVQEAKLVGLDKAMVEKGNSRYFAAIDTGTSEYEKLYNRTRVITTFPMIVSNQPWVDKSVTYTIQKLNVPFNTKEEAKNTMQKVINSDGKLLNEMQVDEKSKKYTYTFSSKQVYKTMMKQIAGIDIDTGEAEIGNANNDMTVIINKPSPLHYQKSKSPYKTKWPYAYNIKLFNDPDNGKEIFRPYLTYSKQSEINWKSPWVIPKWVGTYDPSKLNVPLDPLTELPMETYRPASAKLVLYPDKKPVNPPEKILPSDGTNDLLSQPPSILTTIEAAEKIVGKKPISAIRIKVAGVKSLNNTSQQKLERIAKEIHEKTGLITDITLGSSPQTVLTHVPAINNQKELGWMEQPWVNIGAAFTIYHETQVGFSGIIASVMAVAVVYVLASGLVTLYARRKEFAVLLAIGWRPNQISKLLFLESTIIGSFVAIISWLILGWLLVMKGEETSFVRFLFSGLFGLVIYWLGAIGPAYLTRRIKPYEAMRTGEITAEAHRFIQSRGSFTMAVNHFLGHWKRSVLSIVAMALPTALLSLFLCITFKLQGVLYTSLLGDFVAMQVGPSHYIAMGVAFAIAILTTAELMWQNITERKPEIALLRAVGWQNHWIRILIYWEGLFNGIIAGILGIGLAFLIMWGMYRQLPTQNLTFLLLTGIIPVIAGFLGAFIPAEKAVRIQPAQGIIHSLSNKRNTERWFKWCLLILLLLLLIGLTIAILRMNK